MKSLNICNIYTAAWCLYLLQGFLYAKGSPIGKILILLILLMSLYYFTSNLFRINNTPYLKALNALVVLFTAYGILSMLVGTVSVTAGGNERTGFDFVKQYYSSILPIYAYLSFARDGYINKRWFNKWIYVFFFVAIVVFFNKRSEMLKEAMMLGSQQTEFINNYAYLFISLIPAIVLVSHKKYLPWILWLIVIAFSLYSFKRGAIMTSGICFLYYLYAVVGTKSKKGLRYTWFAVIVFVGVYFVIDYLMANSEYFWVRVEVTQEGSSSHRDELYLAAWQVFINSEPINMLFGHGANSTASLIGNGAHNDWLEILVCFGLIGIFVFTLYWLASYKTWKRIDKTYGLRLAFGTFLIATFMRTLFSFSIGDMSFFEATVVGYCLCFGSKREQPL